MALKVRFSLPPTENKERKRHRKRSKGGNVLSVNIGTSKDFKVDIGGGVSYDVIHSSANSLLARLIEEGDHTDVIVVRWGVTYDAVSDRDHVSATIASDVVTVPEYKGKVFFTVQGRHVSVSLRSFIPGVTLTSVMGGMKPEELDHVSQQVTAIVSALGQKTTNNFGHIRCGRFRAKTAKGFVTQEVLKQKLSGNEMAKRIRVPELTSEDNLPAVFCHRNMSPDHIILNGVEVVGVVGWSRADYLPEALDRVLYRYTPVSRGQRAWFGSLAVQEYCHTSSKPSGLLESYILEHALASSNCSPSETGDGFGFPQAEWDHRNTSRDAASLGSLFNETIDTWERSTIVTTDC